MSSSTTAPFAGQDRPAVELTQVSKQYKDIRAVDDVTLSLESGAIIGLLGRNGAGKTTLMRMLTAQIAPTSGDVRVFGENPYENAPVQSRMCFIREAQKYPDQYTVANVMTAAGWFFENWDAGFAEQLIEEFNLPRKRAIKKLSRGQLSAVGVVVGLASRAPLTFFDEPYLGLDAVARQLFYDRLLQDYADHPRTVVLSTHLIDEVADLLAHVVVIDRGQILIDAPTEELRGTSVTLVGASRAVEEATRGLIAVHRRAVGSIAEVTVPGPLTAKQISRAETLGVEIHSVSLQQHIVNATRDAGAELEEVAS